MKKKRINLHRRHWSRIDDRSMFRLFSAWDKLSRGLKPNIPELNALERIGIKCNEYRNGTIHA